MNEALAAAMGRYADGDASAFAAVYDHLAARLFAFFVRRIANRPWAEDLVQQTLLQMHTARARYVRSSDVVPWAFAIARHLLISSRRRTRREVLFATSEDEAAARDARRERFAMPESLCETAEAVSRMRAALAAIPTAHREAYLLVRREGLSVAQAAEVLGTTPTAVKLRAHRAYVALREALS